MVLINCIFILGSSQQDVNVCPLRSLTYSHIFLFGLVLPLCVSLSDVPFVYTDLQNALGKMHSTLKENDLYAKVTRLELTLVLFGVVEIHFLIYLGNGCGADDVQGMAGHTEMN